MNRLVACSVVGVMIIAMVGCPSEETESASPGGAGGAGGAGGSGDCVTASDCGTDSTCMTHQCEAGACTTVAAPEATPCDEDGGELCDGAGQCVPASCMDELTNGDETDLNCGGSCTPCNNGAACLVPGDCISKFCNEGFCGSCNTDGDCDPVADSFCSSAGECVAKGAQGDSCGGENECLSGFCADATCCDTSCDSGCDDCSTGTCGVSAAGDPGDSTCAPYLCDGDVVSCPTSCSADLDCVAAGFCDLVNSICVDVTKADGVVCTNGNECTSGYCVDGVCCASMDCPGDCNSCAVNGALGVCTADPVGTICRPSLGLCDPEETCDGSALTCPADTLDSAGTPCSNSAGLCDPVELCDGNNPTCPIDQVSDAGFPCRPSVGLCDPVELCDGSSPTCPGDIIESVGTPCRPSVGLCDPAEVCDGTNGTCPAEVLESAGFVCRSSEGDCDPEEICDGVTPGCPVDVLEPTTTECRPAPGECDVADTCDGVNVSCPADELEPPGTPCGNGVAEPVCDPDVCDAVGNCVDVSPPSDGTGCTDDGQFCSGDETCQSAICTSAGDPCVAPLVCEEAGGMCVDIWINEIHYDNASTDVDEGIEVAGTAGADLSGWSIVLYNGSTTVTYGTVPLSGFIPDQQSGFGAVHFAQAGVQNGAPDGLALVDGFGTVVQFLSYEGVFTATDGPAAGMTAVDIGVSETTSTAVGLSLQLTGSGSTYSSFTWTGPVAHTRDAINSGQSFP